MRSIQKNQLHLYTLANTDLRKTSENNHSYKNIKNINKLTKEVQNIVERD